MTKKELKGLLMYYMFQQFVTSNSHGQINPATLAEIIKNFDRYTNFKILLRRIADITEEELNELVFTILDSPQLGEADKLTKEEISITSGEDPEGPFIVCDITCRCFAGQIKINIYNGDIYMYDDDDELKPIEGQGQVIIELLARGFDLFGILDSEFGADKKEYNQTAVS